MRVLFLMLAVICLILPGPVRADLVLAFTPDAAPITFSVVAGQTITIPVYLVERNQAPFTNILSSEGLFSAGVRLNYSTVAGSATVTGGGAVLNPAFDVPTSGFPMVDNVSGFASVSGATLNLAGVPATGTPPSVLVGSFTFLGNQVNNVTTINTAKPQALLFPEFLSNTSGTVLETQTFANIFFAGGNSNQPISYSTTLTTVASVPEPATWVLLGLSGACSLISWRYWNRRMAQRREQLIMAADEDE